jgi:hypothetical protein
MGSKRSSGAGPSVTLRKRLAQIEACERSGESLKVYAERHGLSVHTLYQAKKVARRQGLIPPYRNRDAARTAKPSKEGRPTRFVKAVRRGDVPGQGMAWRLRLSGGEVLESNTPLTVEIALSVIESLGRRS